MDSMNQGKYMIFNSFVIVNSNNGIRARFLEFDSCLKMHVIFYSLVLALRGRIIEVKLFFFMFVFFPVNGLKIE
jgi:hypothetical protein